MSRHGQCGYALQVICQADEQRAAPVSQSRTMCEVPIVEAAAHADAMTLRVESHQRHEHDVHAARCAQPAALWLCDAECAPSYRACQIVKAHAVVTRADDAWQGHAAAAPQRQLQQRSGIQFFRHGQIQADTATGSQPPRGIDSTCHLQCGPLPLDTADCPAACAQRAAQGSAVDINWGAAHGDFMTGRRKEGRHPPVPLRTVALEPEQQVGQASGR